MGGCAADLLPGRPRLYRPRLVGQLGVVLVQRQPYGATLLVRNIGLTIICDGATGAGAAAPHWTTDDLSHVIGVQTIGTSCAGSKPYAMAISPDDYLVACFPADAGSDQLAGQGSTWQIYHP
jgi:hypothetical protein